MTARPSPARRFALHLAASRAIWALWVLASVWIAWFALRVHVYFVMPDELRYVKQAVSWGTGHPVVPGTEHWTTWSQAEPLLLAPFWATLSTYAAYQASHAVNSLVFASAVFPAYLLGRRVLGSHGWSLVAAALTVVLPWSVLAGVMMTEVAAYPLALWAVWAVHRAATEPSPRADLVAIVALLGAFAGRTELILLWPALPVALVAQGVRYPDGATMSLEARLQALARRHALVVALAVAITLVLSVRVKALLGTAPRHGAFAAGTFDYARDMLAYVAVGGALLPLAAAIGWVVATLARPLSPARHAYAVILVAVAVPLALVVGGGSRSLVAVGPVDLGVNDRYLFYIAPLLVLAMFALLLEPAGRMLALLGGALVAGWLLWGAHLALAGPTFVTPTATWHPVLNEYARWTGDLLGIAHLSSGQFAAGVTVVAAAVLAAARRWTRPAVAAGVAAVAVGACCLQQTIYTRDRLEAIQPGPGYGKGRDWVDRSLPRGVRATVLLSSLGVDEQTAQATWWDVTFWNHAVTSTRYLFGGQRRFAAQSFPKPLLIRPADGRVFGLGGANYIVRAVADRRLGFRDETRIGAPHNNLELIGVPQPVRLAWAFVGPSDTGFVPPGTSGFLRVYGDARAGRRTVTIPFGTPFEAKAASRYEVVHDGRRVARGNVALGQVASPGIVVQLPPFGHADFLITAPAGAGSRGVQFYGATVSAAR